MSDFFYFIPGVQAANEKVVRERGLADRIVVYTSMQVHSGPGEKAGMLLRDNSHDKTTGNVRFGYFPDEQVWCEAGGIWVGMSKADPPKPDDLRRDDFINGHQVKLNDGNEWMIPVARAFPTGTNLPCSLSLGPDGELVFDILERYVPFSKHAERLFLEFYGGLAGESEEEVAERLHDLDWFNHAVEALAVNYRVGAQEVSLLKLLTTRNVFEVCRAVVDFPEFVKRVQEMESKKKILSDHEVSDGNSSEHGPGV